jgi:hypothetical protein
MNVEQADEAEELRRVTLKRVGGGLRDYYGDVSKEAIPNRFNDPLRRVDVSAKGNSKE